MQMATRYSWILDSGGAGRGAWQGGVIYEFMRWCRDNGSFPSIAMGASAGGYAAADVATGTENTVMKGWNYWGTPAALAAGNRRKSRFRAHLHNSVHYVMEEKEQYAIFADNPDQRLLIFTTRARRRDMKPFTSADEVRLFLKSATRKFPRPFKYLPSGYIEDPVIFAVNLPQELASEYIRPLTQSNFYAAIEASCLVPFAMGSPLSPENMNAGQHPGDQSAVFIDGGYALKMPMRLFEEDPRFCGLAQWTAADKTIIFSCDPNGCLWETSARLRQLNALPSVVRALNDSRLLIISPDHKVEAGFLCMDHTVTMRTFHRGREQAERLLRSNAVRRFFDQ